MVFHRRPDFPQALNKSSAMLRLDIVEAFVADEIFYLIQPVQRRTGPDQLVKDREHLFLNHRAAPQKNFADGQDLATGQKAG